MELQVFQLVDYDNGTITATYITDNAELLKECMQDAEKDNDGNIMDRFYELVEKRKIMCVETTPIVWKY